MSIGDRLVVLDIKGRIVITFFYCVWNPRGGQKTARPQESVFNPLDHRRKEVGADAKPDSSALINSTRKIEEGIPC
jgi:hypothetical protein